jgi:hypothetical protein
MKNILVVTIAILFYSSLSAQIGIGTVTPDQSAALDVSSNIKGFLPPRLTTAERDGINNPAIGLVIFNTTVKCLQLNNNNGWQNLCPNSPPIASNVQVNGDFHPSYELSATYDYSDPESNPEDSSLIKWYIADDSLGVKTEIPSAEGEMNYTISNTDIDKYVFFSITPRDDQGEVGDMVYSVGQKVTHSGLACGPNIKYITVSAGQGYIRLNCENNKLENRSWASNNNGVSYRYKTTTSDPNYVTIYSWDNTYNSVKTIPSTEFSELTEFTGSNSGRYTNGNCYGHVHGVPIVISSNGYIRINPTTKELECYYRVNGSYCNGASGQYSETHTSTTCNKSFI